MAESINIWPLVLNRARGRHVTLAIALAVPVSLGLSIFGLFGWCWPRSYFDRPSWAHYALRDPAAGIGKPEPLRYMATCLPLPGLGESPKNIVLCTLLTATS